MVALVFLTLGIPNEPLSHQLYMFTLVLWGIFDTGGDP
jgi:hypothetical protein